MDNDILNLHTGFRPLFNEQESETNSEAVKRQQQERNELAPFAELLLSHLEHEKAQVSDLSSFMVDKIEKPEELLDEIRARKLYVKKIEELQAWITTRMSKSPNQSVRRPRPITRK